MNNRDEFKVDFGNNEIAFFLWEEDDSYELDIHVNSEVLVSTDAWKTPQEAWEQALIRLENLIPQLQEFLVKARQEHERLTILEGMGAA